MKKIAIPIFICVASLSGELDIEKFIRKGIRESYSSRANIQLLAISSLSIIASNNYDDDIRQLSKKHLIMSDKLSNLLDLYGGFWAYPSFLSIVASSSNTKEQKTDKLLFASSTLGITIATTYLLKITTHRLRPDKSNWRSFPSGHTSGSFALAAIGKKLYGKDIGGLLYAVASFVGAQRVYSNKHWFTDVIAGATLGTIIGRGFSSAFHPLEMNFSDKEALPEVYFHFSVPIH